MDTVNQFGWAEVAAIAGGALVCLMAVLGILLGVLLKRQSLSSDDCVKKTKEIQILIEDKLDGEIENRKAEVKEIKKIVERGRAERRQDINTLHKKLEAGLDKAVSDFKTMCDYRQGQYTAVHEAQIDVVKNQTVSACKKVEKYDREQKGKWEKQEKFNLRFLGKAEGVGI